MTSLVEGYEYDIFISYRQKDNKYDGWVTEFVENLKKEIDATFKEDVSVYFDLNPVDGLLETHSVDKSLAEKLNCAIFLPVISQTYCDPKSFAWLNEFCAFNKQALLGKSGRDIKLAKGNVTSRILAIKIHDLDPLDKTLLENETGEVLRSIEFIYKQIGVNRPLRPYDDKRDNLNKTEYRDQINKVANSIKEILFALKNFNPEQILQKSKERKDSELQYELPNNKVTTQNSIIVLPFSNMSPNPHDEYFSDGLTEEIITYLANLKSLRVISRSTSMVLKGTTKDIKTIGQELKVDYVLEGSVRKSENKIRITAQLIKAPTDEHLWAERFDGTMDDIFEVQDTIALKIVEALKIQISPIEKTILSERPIYNSKAYDLYILAKNEFHKLNKEGIERGIFLIKKALEIEGDNAKLFADLGYMYWGAYDMGIIHESGTFELMEGCIAKSLALDPKQADALFVKGLILYKQGNLPGCVKYGRLAANSGGDAQFLIAFLLAELGKTDQAIEYSEKSIAADPLGYMPWWSSACVNLFMGHSIKAFKLLRETRDRIAPNDPFLGWWVAQMAAYAGETEYAYNEFKKIAQTDSIPWKEFCKLFQLALDSDRKGAIDHLQNSMINEISKTDEYFPLFIANAFSHLGDLDEALIWLRRAVDWGFSNYRFLAEYNKFLDPLKSDSRFRSIIDQAQKQSETFKD